MPKPRTKPWCRPKPMNARPSRRLRRRLSRPRNVGQLRNGCGAFEDATTPSRAADSLIASILPAAALGSVLSRTSPLRDGGSILLRRLGMAPALFNSGYWATGAIAILIVTGGVLCVRRRIRPYRFAMAAIAFFIVSAGVLALLLPGIRNASWKADLARVDTLKGRGPCLRHGGAVYVLGNGRRQPVALGGPQSASYSHGYPISVARWSGSSGSEISTSGASTSSTRHS